MDTTIDTAYCTLHHNFHDLWEDKEVKLSFRFAKPNISTIKRLQDSGSKNPAQAMRNLLIDTIHPEDKENLINALEEYSGINTTFAATLMKGIGITQELGK